MKKNLIFLPTTLICILFLACVTTNPSIETTPTPISETSITAKTAPTSAQPTQTSSPVPTSSTTASNPTPLANVSPTVVDPTPSAVPNDIGQVETIDASSQYTTVIVASGLDNPRGLAFGKNNELYVAEAGRGGEGACVIGPGGFDLCYGATGSILRIAEGNQERIVTGLPSLSGTDGSFAYGPHDVAIADDGSVYFVVGFAADPAERSVLGKSGSEFATLNRIDSDGSTSIVGDLGAFETVSDPDEIRLESNPYAVLADSDSFIVADAAANSIVRIGEDGIASLVAVFPRRKIDVSADLGLAPGTDSLVESVPTSIESGPDGAIYIGELTGFPYPQGQARIYRIAPGQEPEVFADGFTNIGDIAFDDDGNLYVLEIARNSLRTEDPTGSLIRISSDTGKREILASDSLIMPTGLAIGTNGDIYVSNCGACVDRGQVVRILKRTAAPATGEALGQYKWSVSDVNPQQCQFEIPQDQNVECGWLTVPENRREPNGRTIQLHFAVFHTTAGNSDPEAVVYVAGSPGGNSLWSLQGVPFIFYDRFPPILENQDVILVDQRGTGFSTPSLGCPEYREMVYDTLDDRLSNDEVSSDVVDSILACRDRLEAQGVDLNSYTSRESAADLNDLRIALGYDQWNLYGLAYGTKLVLNSMREYPEGIRSVVMDSSVPLEVDLYAEFPQNVNHAFRFLFDSCTADDVCNTTYPNLENVFYEVVEHLNENPEIISVTNPGTRTSIDALIEGDDILNLLLQRLSSTEDIGVLPKAIYDARDGDFFFFRLILERFLTNLDYLSLGMQYSRQCAEEINTGTPARFASELAKHEKYAPILEIFANPTFEVCSQWGDGEVRPDSIAPVVSDIPTLILNGEFDSATPPRWGEAINQSLTDSRHVQFPGTGHVVSFSQGCALEIALAFIDNPHQGPDLSCVSELSKARFFLTQDDAELSPYTNTSLGISGVTPDRWSEVGPGVFVRSNSSLDRVLIIQQSVPDVDGEQVLQTTMGDFGLTSQPDLLNTRESNGISWSIYQFESDGMIVNLALAETDGVIYPILMQTAPAEHDFYFDKVFLPIVDNLTPISDRRVTPVPESSLGPAIPEDEGYLVEEISDGLYWVTEGVYQSIFLTTGEGVIVVDAPPTIGENLSSAIADVTDEPVKYLVYSHSHNDHIGSAGIFPDDVTIIAHEKTLEQLMDINDPDRPLPTLTFTDSYTMVVGNQTIQLDYHGVNHDLGNIFIYAPRQKVLMVVDIVFSGWVPFRELGEAINVSGFVEAHDQILSYDFDTFIGGHLTRPGTREDVEIQQQYVLDIRTNATSALESVNAASVSQETGLTNLWLFFDTYLNQVAQNCADSTLQKWNGILGGADIFTFDHCYKMMNSLQGD